MKILTWNIRGLNAPDKRHFIKCQVEKQKLIFLLQESKIEDTINKGLHIKGWEGAFSKAFGTIGGMRILWKSNSVSLNILVTKCNWMVGEAKILKTNMKFYLFNIYGPMRNQDKANLWKILGQKVSDLGGKKIVMGGDFNAVLSMTKKIGGNKMKTSSMEALERFLTKK